MFMLAQDDDEHLVPNEMRPRFRALVAALVAGDFQLSKHALSGVAPIEADTARFIQGQISTYGAKLAPLSDEVWDRSAYRWMDGHWAFLIDLSTDDEAVSDLALHAKLFDSPSGQIEVWSVHVP